MSITYRNALISKTSTLAIKLHEYVLISSNVFVWSVFPTQAGVTEHSPWIILVRCSMEFVQYYLSNIIVQSKF